MLAANIVGKPKKGMAATIVDLAVQKNLRIIEHDQVWSKVFGVQKLSSADLAPDEQRVMVALFSVNPFSMGERKSVVSGTSGSIRGDLGGPRSIKKKKKRK